MSSISEFSLAYNGDFPNPHYAILLILSFLLSSMPSSFDMLSPSFSIEACEPISTFYNEIQCWTNSSLDTKSKGAFPSELILSIDLTFIKDNDLTFPVPQFVSLSFKNTHQKNIWENVSLGIIFQFIRRLWLCIITCFIVSKCNLMKLILSNMLKEKLFVKRGTPCLLTTSCSTYKESLWNKLWVYCYVRQQEHYFQEQDSTFLHKPL